MCTRFPVPTSLIPSLVNGFSIDTSLHFQLFSDYIIVIPGFNQPVSVWPGNHCVYHIVRCLCSSTYLHGYMYTLPGRTFKSLTHIFVAIQTKINLRIRTSNTSSSSGNQYLVCITKKQTIILLSLLSTICASENFRVVWCIRSWMVMMQNVRIPNQFRCSPNCLYLY